MSLLTSRYFLIIGGIVLLALGVFGFLVPEPLEDTTVVHFDAWENYIHTIAGVAMLAIGFLLRGANRMYRWWTTLVVGLSTIALAIIGFAVSGASFPNLGGANLENPFDNVLNLVIGVYALATAVIARHEALPGRPEAEEREAEKKREAPPRIPKAA